MIEQIPLERKAPYIPMIGDRVRVTLTGTCRRRFAKHTVDDNDTEIVVGHHADQNGRTGVVVRRVDDITHWSFVRFDRWYQSDGQWWNGACFSSDELALLQVLQ